MAPSLLRAGPATPSGRAPCDRDQPDLGSSGLDLLGRDRPGRLAAPPPRHPGGRRPRAPRPSLLLWRWRHLVVALCVGATALLVLAVLRPAPSPGGEVLVVARAVSAGAVLGEEDLERRRVPAEALPTGGLADESVIGSRAAVALEPGTVLTRSMTSAALASELSPAERVVQVPVEIGAQLAAPGSRVDLVAEPGTGEGSGEPVVVCRGARVLLVQAPAEEGRWAPGAMAAGTTGSNITLITLAVPEVDATLVVGAATNSSLGLVLSP